MSDDKRRVPIKAACCGSALTPSHLPTETVWECNCGEAQVVVPRDERDELAEKLRAAEAEVERYRRIGGAVSETLAEQLQEAIARGVELWDYATRITFVLAAVDRVLNERRMYHASRAIAVSDRVDEQAAEIERLDDMIEEWR